MLFWTTLASRNFARTAAAALAVALLPHTASAELRTDPLLLYKTMKTAYDRGKTAGWHFADELYYLSSVLDAGRAYELVRREDPDGLALKGTAVDLATRLRYNPLTNRDAAEWYVRLAAEAFVSDPQRGAAATALLAKLDAEDADTVTLARNADADATADVADYPG